MFANPDPLEAVWFAIAALGLWASARGVARARARIRRRKGRNGPAMFLARGRRSTARIHMGAFSLFTCSAIWTLAQPPGIAALRGGIIGALVLGFALEMAALVYGNLRDERLEDILTRPAAGVPRRRRDDEPE